MLRRLKYLVPLFSVVFIGLDNIVQLHVLGFGQQIARQPKEPLFAGTVLLEGGGVFIRQEGLVP